MRHILENLAAHAISARIYQHLVDSGVSEADAHAQANAAAAGGLGGVLQWIVTNAPALYSVARVIAAMFGVVLPPLPV